MSRFTLKALQGLKTYDSIKQLKDLPFSIKYKMDNAKMYKLQKALNELRQESLNSGSFIKKEGTKIKPEENLKLGKNEIEKEKIFSQVFGQKVKKI